jgi:hypothetical protein
VVVDDPINGALFATLATEHLDEVLGLAFIEISAHALGAHCLDVVHREVDVHEVGVVHGHVSNYVVHHFVKLGGSLLGFR